MCDLMHIWALVGRDVGDLRESPLGRLTGVVGQKLLTWIGQKEQEHTWGRHWRLHKTTDTVAQDLTNRTQWQVIYRNLKATNTNIYFVNSTKQLHFFSEQKKRYF